MSLHPSQQTLGYLLIALGLFVAIAGYISFRKGGRMKVLTYVVFVLASIGLGIKFATEPQKAPMEVEQVSFPRNPGR